MTVLAQDAPQGNRNSRRSDSQAVIVSEWPVKRGEVARVSIEPWRGTWLVNIRRWFEVGDGELRPGKGIALAVRHLPRLADAVTNALAVARDRGIVTQEHEAEQ